MSTYEDLGTDDDFEVDEYLIGENEPRNTVDGDDTNEEMHEESSNKAGVRIIEPENDEEDDDEDEDDEDDDENDQDGDESSVKKRDLDSAFLEASSKSACTDESGNIIRERINSTQEAMRTLLASMTPEQRKRYETFRRVSLPRPAIRRLLYKILAAPVLQSAVKDSSNASSSTGHLGLNSMVGIGGMAKVFVGELVETAVQVRAEWISSGIEDAKQIHAPLLPSHILEAHRRMNAAHAIPPSTFFRKRSRFL